MSTPLPNPFDIRAGADQVIAYLRQGQQIQVMQALEQTMGWCDFPFDGIRIYNTVQVIL